MALHWMLYTLRAQAEVVVPHHSQWPCSDQHPHKATSVTARADWGCYQHIPHAKAIQLLGSWNWRLLLQNKWSLEHRTVGIFLTKSLLFSLFGQSRQILVSRLPTGYKESLFSFNLSLLDSRMEKFTISSCSYVWVWLSFHLPCSLSNISTTTQMQQKLQWRTWYWKKSDPPNLSRFHQLIVWTSYV
jgi:hypothetical protein